MFAGSARGAWAISALATVLVLAACTSGADGSGRTASEASDGTAEGPRDASAGPPPACPDEVVPEGAESPPDPDDGGDGQPVRLRGPALAAVVADADWIVANQLDSGAITLGPERDAVWGYLANFAARGLSMAAATTGRVDYADAALRWFRWYQDHQEPDGSVHDHEVSPDGVETSTGVVDAVDASAGTYLWALKAWWDATGDRVGLRSLAPSVRQAVEAIVALQDTDGLTWARADWQVKYLMDQAETHAGLAAAVDLADVLGVGELEAEAERAARRLRAGVESMWDETAGGYVWAVHPDGAEELPSWPVLFPDALQQVWAVAFGVACPEREAVVVDRFLAQHPDWFAAPFVGWWAPVTWALEATGRHEGAAAGLDALTEASIVPDRAWPFTPSDAGQLIEARTRRAEPGSRPGGTGVDSPG
jgi:hypothetical protein